MPAVSAMLARRYGEAEGVVHAIEAHSLRGWVPVTR